MSIVVIIGEYKLELKLNKGFLILKPPSVHTLVYHAADFINMGCQENSDLRPQTSDPENSHPENTDPSKLKKKD